MEKPKKNGVAIARLIQIKTAVLENKVTPLMASYALDAVISDLRFR